MEKIGRRVREKQYFSHNNEEVQNMKSLKHFIARLLVMALLMMSFSSSVVLAEDEIQKETENEILTEDVVSEETEDIETTAPFIAGKPGDKVWTKNMSGTNGYTLATLELVTYGSQYPDGYKIIESWREGVLGANGEEIFCVNPMAAFSETKIKNVYNATQFFTQKEITSMGLVCKYVDSIKNQHLGGDKTKAYMFKQIMMWNVLDETRNYYPQYDNIRFECNGLLGGSFLSWAIPATKDYVKNNLSKYKGYGYVHYDGETQETAQFWLEEVSGSMKLKKTSGNTNLTNGNNNYSLSGAVYGVYSNSGCTTKVGELTTDANGNSNTLSLNAGTYYVKETKASKGYELDKNVHKVTVKAGETATVTSKEPPKSGNINLVKTSSKPDVTNENNNYSLAGAEYSVYRNSACTDYVNKIVTDKNGKGSLSNLPLRTYYVKETKASQGYIVDKTVYTANISSGNTAVIETTVNSKETPLLDPAAILLKKVDSETGQGTPQGSASLADAHFKVKYYPVIMDTDPAQSGHTAKKTWVLKTDSKGYLALDEAHKVSGDSFYMASDGKTPALPFGTLTFEEIKAPNGYLINQKIIVCKIDKTQSGGIVYQEPIQKETVLRMDIEKIQAGVSKPIKGVVFEHTKPDGSKETLTTDEKGQLSFKGLQWGNHVVKEISAPDGYSLNTNIIKFTVGKDNKITITSKGVETDTDGNIKITVTKDGNINVVVEDKPVPYELLIHKVNEKDKVLEGAEFTLYSDAECKQEIAKAASKSDGTLRFDNLIVGKTYYMKETKAPEGYRIPVNPDGSDIVYTIKAESIPVDNIFKVIINGKEYDSNSNGDFKVTGTKADRVVDMTITNHTTKKLPETGSYWMIPILILGVCMMVCGRKKPQNPHRE